MAATDRPHAVITGASSGIGAAFAARLASDGYYPTLVARRRSRSAEDRIAAIPRLDLLVNNAGFAGYGPFAGLDAPWPPR